MTTPLGIMLILIVSVFFGATMIVLVFRWMDLLADLLDAWADARLQKRVEADLARLAQRRAK